MSLNRVATGSADDSSVPRHELAVVIPTFMARRHIADVIRGVPPSVGVIVVVDDASPDDSAAVAESVKDPRVRIVRHERNLGVGGATLTGYREAARLGASVVVKMDADGQMDPAALLAIAGPVLRGEADYAKGNRFLHTRELRDMPRVRRAGNLGLSFLAKLASGYWSVFDPTNGYTAIAAPLVHALDHEAIHPRYFFETSLLCELSHHRAVVRDVYLPARYGTERSNLSEGRTLLEFPWLLLKAFVRRVWMQHVLRDFGLCGLFLSVGLPLLGFGVVFGAYHWTEGVRLGRSAPTGTIMLAVVTTILGVQFILQALAYDVQAQPVDPVFAAPLASANADTAGRLTRRPNEAT